VPRARARPGGGNKGAGGASVSDRPLQHKASALAASRQARSEVRLGKAPCSQERPPRRGGRPGAPGAHAAWPQRPAASSAQSWRSSAPAKAAEVRAALRRCARSHSARCRRRCRVRRTPPKRSRHLRAPRPGRQGFQRRAGRRAGYQEERLPQEKGGLPRLAGRAAASRKGCRACAGTRAQPGGRRPDGVRARRRCRVRCGP